MLCFIRNDGYIQIWRAEDETLISFLILDQEEVRFTYLQFSAKQLYKDSNYWPKWGDHTIIPDVTVQCLCIVLVQSQPVIGQVVFDNNAGNPNHLLYA